MYLDIGLNDLSDLLDKAEREKLRLYQASDDYDHESFNDHFFNFSVTVNHIRDWAVKSEKCQIRKQEVDELVRNTKILQACKDISNSIKHYKIELYEPSTNTVERTSYSVAGILNPGTSVHGDFGVIRNDSDDIKDYEFNEININVIMNDGEKYQLQEYCDNAITIWRNFLGEKCKNT